VAFFNDAPRIDPTGANVSNIRRKGVASASHIAYSNCSPRSRRAGAFHYCTAADWVKPGCRNFVTEVIAPKS
jgi:hypothetical protein